MEHNYTEDMCCSLTILDTLARIEAYPTLNPASPRNSHKEFDIFSAMWFRI
jgi:hypothetical protein